MRRRQFAVLLGGMAAWPVVAIAQPKPTSVIGYLGIASPQAFASRLSAFRQGLSEFGYAEGENLGFEYRWAETQYDRLPAFAADLVGRKVDLILTSGPPAAHAAKGATATIPVIFVVGSDPVRDGLVASLARPGGNVTGITLLAVDLSLKRLDLLSELMPQVKTIALLTNPTNAAESRVLAEARQAALARGYELHSLAASTDREVENAFAALAQVRAGALLVSPDSFFTSRRASIVALARRHAVPAIYAYREYAADGGLISYAPKIEAIYTQAGRYAGRVLRGESPADLPVQQPTVFELVINLKTARDLGLEVPPALLARADEVIE